MQNKPTPTQSKTMKRFISIITLIATLGFVLPTPVEAARPKHKPKAAHVVRKSKPVIVAHRAPARVIPRAGRSYYSHRYGPVVVHPARPRRSLFSVLFRL
jgi:hypothetical protein